MTEQQVVTAEADKANPPPKRVSIEAGAKLAAIVPTNVDEAWRLANSIVLAGMVPSSYEVKNDVNGTTARVMIGIMKGLEIGLGPTTALSTIMVVNNRPALWGDGAKALVHASGKVEYIKERLEGEWGKDMVATCEAKRKDQSEPITRTFSYQDAKKAGLTGKTGPWQSYPARMLSVRALAWVLRDGFADALHGLSIAEEVRDIEVEAKRNHTTDTSDLDDVKLLPQTVETVSTESKTETATA